MENTVQYLPANGFPGYMVGNDGTVWTCRKKGGNVRIADTFQDKWKPMKQHLTNRGYCRVNLILDRINRPVLVHTLVLEAFVCKRPDGMEGCHYPDSNPKNNRLENLRWDTRNENAKDKYRDLLDRDRKTCVLCKEIKSLDCFYTDKRAVQGVHSRCKKCHTVNVNIDKEKKNCRNREYMRRRREKIRANCLQQAN